MENNEQSKYDFAERPRSLKELAAHYGRSPKTFRRWLEKAKLDLGIKLGYYFTPRQVTMIMDHMSPSSGWRWPHGSSSRTFLVFMTFSLPSRRFKSPQVLAQSHQVLAQSRQVTSSLSQVSSSLFQVPPSLCQVKVACQASFQCTEAFLKLSAPLSSAERHFGFCKTRPFVFTKY